MLKRPQMLELSPFTNKPQFGAPNPFVIRQNLIIADVTAKILHSIKFLDLN